MTVAVIGAGASGMTAALQSAWNGAAVTIFERNPDVGKKLLVTGSGRCNLTNDGIAAAKYACADSAWMEILLSRFGVSDLLEMLASIGILVYKTSDGWYYPLSQSAHSVVGAFSSALNLAGVSLSNQTQVSSIRVIEGMFAIRFVRDGRQQEDVFERVIVSAGGTAFPTLGSRGDMFPVLEALGHSVLPSRPALAPVLADLGNLRPLQGVRLNVGVTLWNASRPLASTRGNLIFTEWGLNGPAVMDISHRVSAHAGVPLELSLNLLDFCQDEFDRLLAQNHTSHLPVKVLMGAFFPPKVSQILLKNARLPDETPLSDLDANSLARLVSYLKDIRLPVKGVRGFEYCQVSAGGVPVSEVDPRTLESQRIKNLFLTGETLDVVGPCGGYNLHYAFSSGALAGRAAASNSGRNQFVT